MTGARYFRYCAAQTDSIDLRATQLFFVAGFYPQ